MTAGWCPPLPELCWAEGRPLLVWRCHRPWQAISSGPHGGGLGQRWWVLNATVWTDYDRDDPAEHIGELAREQGLTGVGTGLLTAVDVRYVVSETEGGVRADVTTGVGQPVWAAETGTRTLDRLVAGTINIVCWLPSRMSEAALVNAVATATEAKTQALVEAGLPGTGTCTDAVVLLCPTEGAAEPYGGTRSRLGAGLARAVHRAVTAGLKVQQPRFACR
ncbi:adenosylcobinamide amidohydrolase [Longimycelium tulufanense]|uniref:Adenosylcobinamide amidohydrolase n=1 Tax=Longimycelium tulufanense TaxID=907463 RepID=A0A8J3FWG1_9PSEU|nr:adenosylcobinamide amidohydrolase [Longimycelium tulufanense]GGM66139.1 adenosylcobinamide amidohydrolase [Longimycelium tulufanense]